MRFLRHRHSAQPGINGRLALVDELATASPFVASPFLSSNVLGLGTFDASSGLPAADNLGNSTSQIPNYQGWPFTFPGNLATVVTFTTAGTPYTGTISEWTVIAIVRSPSGATTSNGTIVTRNYNGSVVPIHLFAVTNAVFGGAAVFDGSWHTSGLNTNIQGDGIWHVVAGRYKGSSDLTYLVDGKIDAQSTSSIPASIAGSANNLMVGYYAQSGLQWKGDILLAVTVLKALDLSFLRQATQSIPDCWATLFRPYRREFFPLVAGGGGGGGGGGGVANYRWFLTQ